MVNELILNVVKEASKEHADLPDYEERCIEHAEKLEEFMTKMLDGIISDYEKNRMQRS